MQIKHLDHLNLSVTNFAESASWYAKVFGFEVVEQGTYRNAPWGIVKAGDALLCMYEDNRRQPKGDELRNLKIHGVNHFGLRITDRKAWEETIKRENIHVFYGGETRWPYSSSWYIEDPSGYEIEVVLWDEGPRFQR
jgi:catechol 2,3-dioxygenase-like lactoylglutathione lyase family enzyme